MKKYITKQAACGRTISTLGGDYALKWDDETQMSVNAHAALLSQFAKAGGFFDRLVETCPMRLTSHARQGIVTIYTAASERAGGIYRAISSFLSKISSASQLKAEERWQLLIYYAFRKYQLVHRLYPPLMGSQIMLPLT